MDIDVRENEKIEINLNDLNAKEMQEFEELGVRFHKYSNWYGAEIELPRISLSLFTQGFPDGLPSKINLGKVS